MANPYKAASAVIDVAERHGVPMTGPIAQAIADAVLECADDEYRVRMEMTPEYWGQPDAMEAVRGRLRQRLALELADAQLLPVALPREVVTGAPRDWLVDGAGRRVGPMSGKPVVFELVVPVRRPAREAA